jgi:hypothetical protein
MLVCEGYAEDALARAIRDIYLPRNCGVVLQRQNARGFGGARALEIAMELQARDDYHAYGVLIDSDAHWGQAERDKATKNGIYVVENSPCLEATLLRVGGHRPPAATHQCKSKFQEIYGGPPDRVGVIERNFTRAQFDEARRTVDAIERILSFVKQ